MKIDLSKVFINHFVHYAEKDSLLPLEDAKQFYDNTPNSKLVTFEDAGHIPMEEIPERTIEPVLKFIAD